MFDEYLFFVMALIFGHLHACGEPSFSGDCFSALHGTV